MPLTSKRSMIFEVHRHLFDSDHCLKGTFSNLLSVESDCPLGKICLGRCQIWKCSQSRDWGSLCWEHDLTLIWPNYKAASRRMIQGLTQNINKACCLHDNCEIEPSSELMFFIFSLWQSYPIIGVMWLLSWLSVMFFVSVKRNRKRGKGFLLIQLLETEQDNYRFKVSKDYILISQKMIQVNVLCFHIYPVCCGANDLKCVWVFSMNWKDRQIWHFIHSISSWW